MTNRQRPAMPSDLVASAIRQTRLRRGWTAENLADRCRAVGAEDLTTAVIANIETGRRGADGARRRHVTVEELLTLAYVLGVTPTSLLLPVDLPLTAKVAVAPVAATATTIFEARTWIRGQAPLRGQDVRTYFGEQFRDEYRRNLQARMRHTSQKAERAEIEAELAAYDEKEDHE